MALLNNPIRFVHHVHINHLSVQGVGGGGLQAADGDKIVTEQKDEHNGATSNSEASVPGPFGQIFGNTGQFLQNIIPG